MNNISTQQSNGIILLQVDRQSVVLTREEAGDVVFLLNSELQDMGTPEPFDEYGNYGENNGPVGESNG